MEEILHGNKINDDKLSLKPSFITSIAKPKPVVIFDSHRREEMRAACAHNLEPNIKPKVKGNDMEVPRQRIYFTATAGLVLLLLGLLEDRFFAEAAFFVAASPSMYLISSSMLRLSSS
jgi:hypothetical protein